MAFALSLGIWVYLSPDAYPKPRSQAVTSYGLGIFRKWLMLPSQTCIDLVKRFEGCCLDSYLCPASIPTVGYGHTVGVKLGESITQDEAEHILSLDLAEFGRSVSHMVKVPISQNQFDALVSFSFNVGAGALQKSDLLKFINSADFKAASQEFCRWNKAGKKVLPGLTARRSAEQALFDGESL